MKTINILVRKDIKVGIEKLSEEMGIKNKSEVVNLVLRDVFNDIFERKNEKRLVYDDFKYVIERDNKKVKMIIKIKDDVMNDIYNCLIKKGYKTSNISRGDLLRYILFSVIVKKQRPFWFINVTFFLLKRYREKKDDLYYNELEKLVDNVKKKENDLYNDFCEETEHIKIITNNAEYKKIQENYCDKIYKLHNEFVKKENEINERFLARQALA